MSTYNHPLGRPLSFFLVNWTFILGDLGCSSVVVFCAEERVTRWDKQVASITIVWAQGAWFMRVLTLDCRDHDPSPSTPQGWLGGDLEPLGPPLPASTPAIVIALWRVAAVVSQKKCPFLPLPWTTPPCSLLCFSSRFAGQRARSRLLRAGFSLLLTQIYKCHVLFVSGLLMLAQVWRHLLRSQWLCLDEKGAGADNLVLESAPYSNLGAWHSGQLLQASRDVGARCDQPSARVPYSDLGAS